METRVTTIIIEPRLLVREALGLLMGNHSYRVVCGFASLEDVGNPLQASDCPELVILGAQSTERAVIAADAVRKLWPSSKIILLFDHASPADFQKMLVSQIDGCIPLSASPEILIGTLDLIVTGDVRVMVVGDTKRSSNFHSPRDEERQLGTRTEVPQLNGAVDQAMPITIAVPQHFQLERGEASSSNVGVGDTRFASLRGTLPTLSERETQILNGLVKGHANKVIARMCDITEATVKVHMKSILRKIRVGNRTQAAIWALENGYPGDAIRDREMKSGSNVQNAAL